MQPLSLQNSCETNTWLVLQLMIDIYHLSHHYEPAIGFVGIALVRLFSGLHMQLFIGKPGGLLPSEW